MIIIGVIVFVILIYVVVTYNSFVFLQKSSEQARSTIDVYLKQRFDLIPNLVECVKGYKEYEQELLERIVQLRQQYDSNHDIESATKLNEEYNRIMMVIEDYPEIKAGEQFMHLQKTLSKVESQLQAARRIYNGDVTKYNTKLSVVPSNIVGMMFGYKQKELFKIDENEANNIKMEL